MYFLEFNTSYTVFTTLEEGLEGFKNILKD